MAIFIKQDNQLIPINSAIKLESEYYQLRYPYTASSTNSSSSYGSYFTQTTFTSEPTTTSGYGAHSLMYISTQDNKIINLSNYSKLYYLTTNTSAPIELPDDTELYVRNVSSDFTMSSKPYNVGDSYISKIGVYSNTNNSITTVSSSKLFDSNYYSGTPYFNSVVIYAKVGSYYRIVYLLLDKNTIDTKIKLYDASVGSTSRGITSGGTKYTYTMGSISTYSNVSSTSMYWGDNKYDRKLVYTLILSNLDGSSDYGKSITFYANKASMYKYI